MNKQIKTEIVINASKQTVWAVLTDFAAYPAWNPFIVKIEGDLKLGGKLKNSLRSGNQTMTFKPTITELLPGERFSWLGSLFVKGIFDGFHSFQIEELAENQVKLIHGEQFSGLLSSFILKKIGEDTRNNFIAMNRALKERAEGTIV